MTAISPPSYIQASTHPADVFRRAILMVARGQSGVRDYVSGDLAVSQNGTPNMSVNVAAGQCAILGTQNTIYQGLYSGALNDATVNLTIAAADPTNPRIDIVVASVQDAAYSGSNNQWLPQVITGTPAPSPSPPATPANSIVLAQVAVAANATSITSGNITDKRPVMGSVFHAEVYQAAAQSLGNNVFSVVAFDTIEGDPFGSFTTGASAHYTVPVAGRVRVSAAITMASPNSTLALTIERNAVEARRLTQGSGIAVLTLEGSATVRCSASDTLDIRTYQNSGGAVNTSPGSQFVYAQFEWLGPL